MAYEGRLIGDYTGPTGNPATANVAAMYYPGQLGQPFSFAGITYVWVQLSATASTAADGQVLYWKDRANFVVSNKLTEAVSSGGRNWACGICPGVITAGNFFCMKVAGVNVKVLTEASGAIGDMVVASATATLGLPVAAANATYVPASALYVWGIVRTAQVAGVSFVDISFMHIP